MGFHRIFAEKIREYISTETPQRIAFLGDQEVMTKEGGYVPVTEYLGNYPNVSWAIVEHPKYSPIVNQKAEIIRVDLGKLCVGDLRGFDMVVDGGTLEHVFDFASAFKTIWGELDIAGRFIFSYPINNLVDHGYWLPQPRLFYDFLGLNGGEVEYGVIFQHDLPVTADGRWSLKPYTALPPETMSQPQFIEESKTAGIFIVSRKVTNIKASSPSEFD